MCRFLLSICHHNAVLSPKARPFLGSPTQGHFKHRGLMILVCKCASDDGLEMCSWGQVLRLEELLLSMFLPYNVRVVNSQHRKENPELLPFVALPSVIKKQESDGLGLCLRASATLLDQEDIRNETVKQEEDEPMSESKKARLMARE